MMKHFSLFLSVLVALNVKSSGTSGRLIAVVFWTIVGVVFLSSF